MMRQEVLDQMRQEEGQGSAPSPEAASPGDTGPGDGPVTSSTTSGSAAALSADAPRFPDSQEDFAAMGFDPSKVRTVTIVPQYHYSPGPGQRTMAELLGDYLNRLLKERGRKDADPGRDSNSLYLLPSRNRWELPSPMVSRPMVSFAPAVSTPAGNIGSEPPLNNPAPAANALPQKGELYPQRIREEIEQRTQGRLSSSFADDTVKKELANVIAAPTVHEIKDSKGPAALKGELYPDRIREEIEGRKQGRLNVSFENDTIQKELGNLSKTIMPSAAFSDKELPVLKFSAVRVQRSTDHAAKQTPLLPVPIPKYPAALAPQRGWAAGEIAKAEKSIASLAGTRSDLLAVPEFPAPRAWNGPKGLAPIIIDRQEDPAAGGDPARFPSLPYLDDRQGL